MTRNKNNPLDGLSQVEIDIIMAKKCADRNPEETRVYKKVKYDAWILKKDKAPSVPTKPIVTPPVIPFVKDEKKLVKNEKKISLKKRSNGKIPNWVEIPKLTDSLKEWTENRTILIGMEGSTNIALLNWLEDDELPTVSMSNVSPFFLSWDKAFCAVKYAFVWQYKRDAILKENTIEKNKQVA